jgi:hypothetical protein
MQQDGSSLELTSCQTQDSTLFQTPFEKDRLGDMLSAMRHGVF